MKSFPRLVAAGVFALCGLQPHPAEARSSTPEERARFVALVRLLEKDPLAENANAARQQLREWVSEVPDIRFKACPDLLGHVIGETYPYAREVNLQIVLSVRSSRSRIPARPGTTLPSMRQCTLFVAERTTRIRTPGNRGGVRVLGRRIQGISPSRRCQRSGHSKPRDGGTALILELSERARVEGDPSGRLPDRCWNVCCDPVDDRRRRHARVAAASVFCPVVVLAINRCAQSVSDYSWRRPTARSAYDMTANRTVILLRCRSDDFDPRTLRVSASPCLKLVPCPPSPPSPPLPPVPRVPNTEHRGTPRS